MGKAAIRGYRFSRHNAFPKGESKEEAASPPKKEANPASLRSAAPSKGRGSRGYSLLPMEGGAPKGRRLDGGKRDEKERERSSQVRPLREHPSAAKKEANPASLRSAAPSKGRGSRGHFLLPMEKAAIRGWLYPRHKAFFLGCQYPFFLSTSFMSFSPRAKATKFIWRRLVSLSQKSGTMEAMCGVMMTLSICQKG